MVIDFQNYQEEDVQYYLYHRDVTGTLLSGEIWKAAERGVRVRMLLDDMDMAGKDQYLAILNAHKNIEVRLFNPFIRGKYRSGQYITGFGSVTRRAHNKAFIVDNQVAIVGGRNIGDQYFGADANLSFGDLDVAIGNPGAQEVSTEFDLYWNSPLAYPAENLVKSQPTSEDMAQVGERLNEFYLQHNEAEYLTRLRDSEMVKKIKQRLLELNWGKVTVLYDHPDKLSSDRTELNHFLTPKLAPYINNTKKEKNKSLRLVLAA